MLIRFINLIIMRGAEHDCLPGRGQHVQLHGPLQRDCRGSCDERRSAAAESRDHCCVQSVPQEARHRGRAGANHMSAASRIVSNIISLEGKYSFLRHMCALTNLFRIHRVVSTLTPHHAGQDGRTGLQRARVERRICRFGHSRSAGGPRHAVSRSPKLIFTVISRYYQFTH